MNAAVGPQWRIAQAERIRAAMGPEMCAVADALRTKFGEVKLNWLQSPTLTTGTPPWDEVAVRAQKDADTQSQNSGETPRG